MEDVPDFAPLGNFQITPELQLKYVRHESRNHDVFSHCLCTCRQLLREHAREDGTVHVEDIHKMMNKVCHAWEHSTSLST